MLELPWFGETTISTTLKNASKNLYSPFNFSPRNTPKTTRNEENYIGSKLHGLICVDCSGQFRFGGLALLWNNTNAISLSSCSLHHIDVTIGESIQNFEWRFTGIYGYPDGAQEAKTWELLRSLHSHSSLPWLCAGDFNEIPFNVEKKGDALRTNIQLQGFRDIIEYCNLQDMGFQGYPFTWSNKEKGTLMSN